jgi:DNA mismatch repair protein MutS
MLPEVCTLLEEAIREDAKAGITEGEMIRRGYNAALDELLDAAEQGQNWILTLEKKEQEATGIKNLRVKYNKVFGYFIEVTNSYLKLVPYRYVRKQTLTNCERFITEALKEMEDTILHAEENRKRMEQELFEAIRDVLKENIARMQKTAAALAALDVLQSLAEVAYENNFVRPKLTENGTIHLKDSRHPVVERTMKNSFVPNDVTIDRGNNNVLLITGPNMAGKSTYMRQTGLIVLMAHMGSFVPASYAEICLVDRIFTRVGASDDLASGQSTFMVEMNELANILNNATEKSLLILDEIGRGTSTVDGLAIAWASVEYIIEHIGAKTMFATHYHELIGLEQLYDKIKNCSVAVSEIGHEIVFLHKIVDGGTDKSFGIEVARLAGLPKEVITKSRRFLDRLQNGEAELFDAEPAEQPQRAEHNTKQLFYLKQLEELDVEKLTPIEALNYLYNIQKEMTDG